jgi:hypothetical protein
MLGDIYTTFTWTARSALDRRYRCIAVRNGNAHECHGLETLFNYGSLDSPKYDSSQTPPVSLAIVAPDHVFVPLEH